MRIREKKDKKNTSLILKDINAVVPTDGTSFTVSLPH